MNIDFSLVVKIQSVAKSALEMLTMISLFYNSCNFRYLSFR